MQKEGNMQQLVVHEWVKRTDASECMIRRVEIIRWRVR